MRTVKQILAEIFPKVDAENAEQILYQYNFYDHLNSCLNVINNKIEIEDEEVKQFGSIQLGAIASSMLVGVNEKLRLLIGTNYNKDLVQIVSDVANKILEHIFSSTKSDRGELLKQLAISLHDTCSIYNYKEEELFQFFHFKELQHYAKILISDKQIIKLSNSNILQFYK